MITSFNNKNRVEQGILAIRFQKALAKRQQLLSDAFQKGSAKLSRKTLYIFLFSFCLCSTAALIWIAFTAITMDHAAAFAHPVNVTRAGASRKLEDYFNMQQQWQYIHNLKEFSDSLKKMGDVKSGNVVANK